MLEDKKKEALKESINLSERTFGLNVELYAVLLSLYDLRTDRVVTVCRPFLLYTYQELKKKQGIGRRKWAISFMLFKSLSQKRFI